MPDARYLAAVEIGGTKLQLAIARDDAPEKLLTIWRTDICRENGAAGILAQIEHGFRELSINYRWDAIGIGFGGPVDSATGRVSTSHQVRGWDGFELASWFQQRWPVPVLIENDCNVAAFAESHLGSGRGYRRVLYVTVGTGIGGGFVIDGRIDGGERPAITEIGHLRPGLDCTQPTQTVESIASGLGIEQTLRAKIQAEPANNQLPGTDDLLTRCQGNLRNLTVPIIAQAAAEGNPLAQDSLASASKVLGWALAQATTLLAPHCIVLGGGVVSIGPRFLQPVTDYWRMYQFPTLRGSCEILRVGLGDHVVLFGGILLARNAVIHH